MRDRFHLLRVFDRALDPHAEAFVDRLDTLEAIARHVSHGDLAAADDLLQDAYVQFVTARPALDAIEHLDAYLARLLRNLHVSRCRRQARQPHLPVDVSEFDSAELALRASGLDRAVARDTLVRVCVHLCERKTTSRAAAALALRFVHGFHPAEIALIARTPARTIHAWLWEARDDLRAALAAPVGRTSPAMALPPVTTDDPQEILQALQRAIFAAVVPPCPTETDEAWHTRTDAPLSAPRLSHVVSCEPCLDAISRQRGLGALGDRSPLDAPSRPSRPAPRASRGALLRTAARRAALVQAHRPAALHVGVNGFAVGWIGVDSRTTRARWTVAVDEPPAFAEIHSEQGVCLAFLPLAPAVAGDVVQHADVRFEDGRTLTLAIDGSERQPAVVVEYVDPAWTPHDATGVAAGASELVTDDVPEAPGSDRQRSRLARAVRRLWPWPRRGATEGLGMFRPVAVLAGVLLAAVAVYYSWPTSDGRTPATLDVAALLARADAADRRALPPTDVVHRTLRFTVRPEGGGVTTRRIESWLDGGATRAAARVFDASGALVGGRWVGDNGTTTLRALGMFDDVWTSGLSVAAFRARVEHGVRCQAENAPPVIRVACLWPTRVGGLSFLPVVHAQASATQISAAELVMRAADLHPLRITLHARYDARGYIVELAEDAAVRMPRTSAPAAEFAPDAVSPPRAADPAASRLPAAVLGSSLEVQIVDVVDRLGRDYGLLVERVGDRRLRVSGLVPDPGDRARLIDGLRALDAAGAIDMAVRTFAEAATVNSAARPTTPAAPEVAHLDLPSGPAPFEAYLRARHPAVISSEAETQRLAGLVLPAVRRVRREARALVVTLRRYPADSVGSFDAEGRRAWAALVDRPLVGSVEALQRLDDVLAPYLESAVGGEPPDGDLASLAHALDHESAMLHDNLTGLFLATSPGDVVPDVAPDLRAHLHRASSLARALRAGVERLRESNSP